jgi:hypothetical protein
MNLYTYLLLFPAQVLGFVGLSAMPAPADLSADISRKAADAGGSEASLLAPAPTRKPQQNNKNIKKCITQQVPTPRVCQNPYKKT